MRQKNFLLEVADSVVRLFQGNGENEVEFVDASVNVHECASQSVEDVFLRSGEFRLFSALLENISESFARIAALVRRLYRCLLSVVTSLCRLCRSYGLPSYAYRVVEGFANLHLWKATDGQPLAANVPIRSLILNYSIWKN